MQAVLVRHIFAFVFSFLLGIYLLPIIIRAAKKIGFMDIPDGKLKHQKTPIPYLGGVAVFIPFITTLGLCYPFENQIMWLLLGTTLLLFIGLIDDLKVLKPNQKFFGQFIAVLCFMKGEFSLKTPFFSSSYANVFWSGFWMLSVINAFNLVDVMDGLCALLALVSAVMFGLIAYMACFYTTSVLLAAFIGSIAAFIVYNRPPARIYLGDAGSLFIGGFMAAVPLLFPWNDSLFMNLENWSLIGVYIKPLCDVFLIPCFLLAVPLLEGLGLFLIRSYLGIPFYNGSPHHFSLYLQRRGWNKRCILVFALCMSLLFSAIALLFIHQKISLEGMFAGCSLLTLSWIVIIFS